MIISRLTLAAFESDIDSRLPGGFSRRGGIRLVLSFDDPEQEFWYAEFTCAKRRAAARCVSGGPQITAGMALTALLTDVIRRLEADPSGGFL